MKQSEYNFSSSEIEAQLKTFSEKEIKLFFLHDEQLKLNKAKLIHFIQTALREAPDVFYSIPIDISIIDMDLIRLLQSAYCSLDIDLFNPVDKKLFSKKATLLNNNGLVFGFNMDYALKSNDSISLFRDRLDFALSLYPNHINFEQLENRDELKEIKTATFSSQDIAYASNIAFACSLFYSSGRSVPWFLSVLSPLKIKPTKFFSDFSEWAECNNCGRSSNFKPSEHKHPEIEKMQLKFLEMKYEEKHIEHLFPVVFDVVRLNGALSRVAADEEDNIELKLSFNPDDLLSPLSMNLPSFNETVCMEECHVKVFVGYEGPDYKII